MELKEGQRDTSEGIEQRVGEHGTGRQGEAWSSQGREVVVVLGSWVEAQQQE